MPSLADPFATCADPHEPALPHLRRYGRLLQISTFNNAADGRIQQQQRFVVGDFLLPLPCDQQRQPKTCSQLHDLD
ncbi:MAG: hypothetical protein ACK5SX_07935, partial [Sandaracinobacter sp.]